MRSPVVLGLLLLVGTACPKSATTPGDTPPATNVDSPDDPLADPVPADDQASATPSETADAKPAGEPCSTEADCQSGICEGEGCDDDQPGQCVDSGRMCTRDAVAYCGCDGKTFVASGSCPGQRYAARGPCEGDPSPLAPK